MIKLTINNSQSQIEGLDIAKFKQVKKLLSYETSPQAKYFSGSFNNTKYLLSTKGVFPTGVIYLVVDYLRKHKLVFSVVDYRKHPQAHYGLFEGVFEHKPYPEQKAAVEACKRSCRGIVSASTGSGKSLIIALLIQALQVRTLVVVPSLELKRQLTELFVKIFGKERVGGLGKDIAVENVGALDYKEKADYDCLIIDEFHHSAAKTYRKLNQKSWTGIFYRFGFTATAFRSQDHERLLLESVLSNVVYDLPYQTAVDKGYIVPLEAYYIELPTVECNEHSWPTVYSKLVTNNKYRNDLINRLMIRLTVANKSHLVLVKEIEHGEALSWDGKFRFANGENEDTKDLIAKFNSRELYPLIGTVGVLGEGIDTKPCEYVVLAGLGKSKPQLMQNFGRAVRRFEGKESGKIILFYDKSHRWTRNHFRAQCKVLLDSYGIKPVKLEI